MDIYGGMKTVNKIRIIDVLNKIANGNIDEVPNKFVFAQQKFTKNGSYIEDEYGDSIFESLLTDFSNLDDEIEIIEEPKEELEEIELIDIHYINGKCIFKVDGKQIDETIALKVNELIENQNKIIRELKANKGNE